MLRAFVALAFACLLTGDSTAAPLVRLPPPVDGLAPPLVVQTWATLVVPVAPADSAVRPIVFPSKLPAALVARADVFARREKTWVWTDTFRYDGGGLPIGARTDHLGVLIRFVGRTDYAWGEAPGGSTAPIPMAFYRSLSVSTVGRGRRTIAVYSEMAEAPIVVRSSANPALVNFVPVGPALVCAADTDGGARCASARVAGDVQLEATVPTVRVIRTPRVPLTTTALAPALSALRPRNVDVATTVLHGWLTLDVRDIEAAPLVAVDFRPEGFAVERLWFRDMPPVPAFATVREVPERGVRVSAHVRDIPTPVESTARLLLFAQEGGAAERLPLGKATGATDGTFTFPEIPPGAYRLKLLSIFAGDHASDAVLNTDGPVSVEFDAAPLVKGKLELAAGGDTNTPPTVTLLRTDEIPVEKMRDNQAAPDVSSWIREAAVGADGSFAAAVHQAGAYTLHARWGHGIATRAFTVSNPPGDVDLGTIVVRNAAAVRGIIHDCAGAEIQMTPMPDLAHPTKLTFADLRRVPAEADGTFVVDAIFPGTWLLGAMCDGKPTLVEPTVITIEEGQQLVLDLHPSNAEPTPPPNSAGAPPRQ